MTINTSREAELLPVIQADRDAAAEIARTEFWDFGKSKIVSESRCIIRGSWDDHPLVQAFAQHRIAALTTRIVGSGVEDGEGRSPLAAGRDTQASPEAPTGLRHSVSVPNADEFAANRHLTTYPAVRVLALAEAAAGLGIVCHIDGLPFGRLSQ